MKAQILIVLLVFSMLLFGCTQTQEQPNTNTNNATTADTNVLAETQIIEQEINEGWINENETIDVGSVL